jgi:hypothetical protein
VYNSSRAGASCLPSLPLASGRSVLLGYAVTTWSRNRDVSSVMSRATVHGAAFLACLIPAFIGETEGSAKVEVEVGVDVMYD